jgi:tetratricopeptide (TPR) repeat protein
MPLAPKVTDFGLAKRLDGDSGQTRSGQVVGTPSYMAPEQAAGQGNLAGPAADVYALGAILYECLTGRPPFQAATSIDTLLLVLEQDPVPPTRLQPKLPRDLETVCLKCLAKEPRKRYATAEALADDLRRFLDGRPVLARRTPGWERAWKWARRKPAWAAQIALAVGAAGAIAGLGYNHVRELERFNRDLERKNDEVRRERDETRVQRDRAEANLGNAVEAVDGMLVRVGLARLAHLPHIDRTRAALLADALTMYDRLLATQRDDPRLRVMMAYTYERSGSILLHLGRTDEARERFDRSLALLRGVGQDTPAGAIPETALRFKARAHSSLGIALLRAGATDQARAEQEAALAVREELFAAHPTDPEYRYDLASSYHDLALLAHAEKAPDRVSLYLGRARPHVEELTRSHPGSEAYAYLAGLVLNDSGVYCLETDDTPRAVSFLERGLESWRKLVAIAPGDRGYRRELARSLSNLGTAWRFQGHLKRATGLYAEALTIREGLAGDHPEARDLQIDLAWSYVRTGDLHAARGESEPAVRWYTRVIDRLGTGPGEPRRDGRAREALREAYLGRAAAFERMNRAKDAADDRRRAAELGGDASEER